MAIEGAAAAIGGNSGAAAPLPPHSFSKKDALQGQIEYLVSPLLPARLRPNAMDINDPHQEGAVAKQAVTVDSVEKLNAAECTNGKPVGIILPCDTAEERMPSQDLRNVHVQATSRDDDTSQLAMAQKKNDLLQASMRILHKKLDELCRQQLALQEDIAECEMNIQTISNGGETGVGSNIELIIEECNNLCKTQKLVSTPLSFEEQIPNQMKRKRLSEVVLSLQSPSQELHNICQINSWIMPRYHVFPSLDSGMYQATIMVQGIDFQFTVDGALKSTPRDARDSAASNGLAKLRRMVEQAQ